MSALLVTWIVTAVSFFIISKLPIGVEIDSLVKSLMSAAVFGIVTAIVRPILDFFFAVPNFLSFNLFPWLFAFIAGAICFGLAAWLVKGFRLRYGWISAALGAFALSLVSNLIYNVLFL
jgi:putative membrane protein